MFAIAVGLNIVVQNAFDEVQEPPPDNREGMTRGNLSVGDAVDGGGPLGLLSPQNFVGHLNNLCKACPWQPLMINGLGRSKFNYTTATYGRSCSLEVY